MKSIFNNTICYGIDTVNTHIKEYLEDHPNMKYSIIRITPTKEQGIKKLTKYFINIEGEDYE